MAIRRFSTSTIVNNLLRYAKFWDQTSTFSAAPTNSYFPIASFTVPSGGVSTITFAGLPQTYSHLQIRVNARSTFADTDSFLIFRVNGDTGNNYPNHFLTGDGSTASAAGYSTATYNYAFLLMYAAASATASVFGGGIIDILDYKDTNKNKTIRALGGFDRNGAGTVRLNSSVWLNTNAITSVTMTDYRTGNFAEHTNISIYGVN
jgi:hypothetical protein